MIHLPTTSTRGNQVIHRESVQMLDTVTGSILAAYETKCKGKTTRDALRRMMDKETFLTAQQALEIGLLDKIQGESTSPVNVFNAAFELPDITKLRAAYQQKQECPSIEKQARARVIALAEAFIKPFEQDQRS